MIPSFFCKESETTLPGGVTCSSWFALREGELPIRRVLYSYEDGSVVAYKDMGGSLFIEGMFVELFANEDPSPVQSILNDANTTLEDSYVYYMR